MPRPSARRARLLALAVAAAFAPASSALAATAPGTPDAAFGTAGVVSLATTYAADRVFVQPDGKIVAIGASAKSGDIVASRFLPSGAADASYGSGGVLRFGESGITFGGAAMQAGGAVVFTGNHSGNGNAGIDPFVARITPSGALDQSFGVGGVRSLPGAAGVPSYFTNIAITQAGAVVLTGTAYTPEPPNRLAVARVTASGALDTTYEQTGIQTMDLGPHADQDWVTAVQPDGKLLVGGTDTESFSVSRFLPNGSPDLAFSADGTASVDLGESYELVRSITVSGDAITATGDFYDFDNDPSAATVAVARFRSDGSLDTSFSGDGSEVVGIGSDLHNRAAALDPQGRLLVIGDTYAGELRIGRLLPDGGVDATYGSAGALGFQDLTGDGIALQSDGALVLGGQATGGVRLVRVVGGGALPTPPPPPTTPPATTPVATTPAPAGQGTAQGSTPGASPQSGSTAAPVTPTTTKPVQSVAPAKTTPTATLAPAFVVPGKAKRTALAKGVIVRLTGLAPSSGVQIVVTAGSKRLAKLTGKADATGTVRIRLKLTSRALIKAKAKRLLLAYRYATPAGPIATLRAAIAVK